MVNEIRQSYRNVVSRRHPGLVIFMIDRSALGQNDGVRGKSLAEIAAEIVNVGISNLERIATRPLAIDDVEVRDYFYVCILGYGEESFNNVRMLYNGWISDISSKFPVEVINSFEGYSQLHIRKIINPVCGYDSPMSTALEEVRKWVVAWKNNGHNNELDISPLLINITHGETFENELGNSKEEIRKSAHKILDLSFPDGAPLICNIITRKIEENEYNKLHNINGAFSQLLLSVSSKIDDEKLLFNVNNGQLHELLFEVLCSWSGYHRME